MLKKVLQIGLIVLVTAVLAVYLYPTPQKSFAELYEPVDEATAVSLQSFRQSHPTQQIEVDGRTWEYVHFGQGEETILFLHGMTGSYDIWWQVMENLADDYQVISLTYPPVDNLDGMAQGVLAILQAEGVTSVNLVGSSLGGYFAQYLVAAYPEMVATAVFANTFPPNDIIAEENKTLGACCPSSPNGPSWAS